MAYNFGCRALYNLPWRASVRSHLVQYNIPTFEQARRQDLATRGAKTRRRGQKPEDGSHFKNSVLDVCSNQEAKREMGDTDFKWGPEHHWPPAGDDPAFEALLRKYTYLFLERCIKSNNVWLRALMQSDCLYSSPFFEHYNRILLCE